MRLARAGLMGMLWVLGACDALIPDPRAPDLSAEITRPVGGASLMQVGPTLSIEVMVQGCDRIRSLHIDNDRTKVARLESPVASDGRVAVEVSVNDWLGRVPLAVDPEGRLADLSLTAQVVCDDFDQEATSPPTTFGLRPTALIQPAPRGVTALFSPTAGSVLAVGESRLDGLRYRTEGDQVFAVSGGSSPIDERSDASIWQLEDLLYLWKSCQFCGRETSGQLYRLQLDPLRLRDRMELECKPTGVARRPHSDQVVIASSGCANTAPLAFTDTELRDYSELGIRGQGLVTELRYQKETDALVGLGYGGRAGDFVAQLFHVPGSAGASYQPLGTPIDLEHTVAAMDTRARRAAWVDTAHLTLHRLDLTPDAFPRQTTLDDIGSPTRLVFVGPDALVLSDGATTLGMDWRDSTPRWRLTLDGKVVALAALSAGRVAVLTAEANLLVLGAQGQPLLEQGPLSAIGQPQPTLLATADGFVHYVVEGERGAWLLSYRVDEPAPSSSATGD